MKIIKSRNGKLGTYVILISDDRGDNTLILDALLISRFFHWEFDTKMLDIDFSRNKNIATTKENIFGFH